MKKILFVLIDGVADKQPLTLKEAKKPNLDLLAKNGYAGLVNNQLSEHPDSAISAWMMFGYPIMQYPGRGILDALGSGIKPKEGNIYFRANFATVKETQRKNIVPLGSKSIHRSDLIVTDRRAGRDVTGLDTFAKAFSRLIIEGVSLELHHTVAHRGVLVLKGRKLSPEVSGSDPGKVNEKVKPIQPLNKTNMAMHTASVLNQFGYKTHRYMSQSAINRKRAMPANYILLRGASACKPIKSFKEKYGMKAACIAASPCEKGIAKLAGFDVPEVKGATADLKTDLNSKLKATLSVLKDHDFVLLHILGCDVAGHDGTLASKAGFLEKIDRQVIGSLLKNLDFENTILVVSSDHITDVTTRQHEAGPFPFVIYTDGIEANNVKAFDENSCRLGPEITSDEFMEEVMKSL